MKIAFTCGLWMLFIRISVLPEVIVNLIHVDTYILYLITPPVVLGLIVTGGFGRALRNLPVMFWCGMLVCMLCSVPFSIWVGNSAQKVLTYARTDFIALFVLAGTVVNWGQIRRVCNMLAGAGVAVICVAAVWARPDSEGRLMLDFGGTIGNSNDLAAHLILLMPFMVLHAIKPGRGALVRYGLFGLTLYGLWIIIGTASRGALISVAVITLILFMRSKASHKLMIGVAIPALAAIVMVIAPGKVLERLATLFISEAVSEVSAEAGASMDSRRYLLEQSIKFTLENPLFGVGPGQFANFEGQYMTALGKHGNWHATHNSYTEMSSECGMPALIFMILGLGSAVVIANRTYVRARKMGNEEIMRVSLYFLCAMLAYAVTITFLSCAYRFTLPTMVGFAVAIRNASLTQLTLTKS